ncbi:MAG: hypothetical protein MZW92_19890 [Comamonadaceae bacterium]|nr:hypothetical protein [Comamonadaceae bacterium]
MTLLRGLGVEELDQARADRRVGIQAGADGARQAQARRLHGARSRAMTERIVERTPRSYEPRHRARRLRHAGTPCPNCGGVVQGELPALCLHRCGRHPKAAASRSPRSRPAARFEVRGGRAASLRDKQIGPLEGFRSKAGWPFAAEIALKYRRRDRATGSWSSTSATTRTGEGDRRAGGLLGPATAGRLPQVRRRTCYEHGANYVCETAPCRRRTATSCDFKSGKIILQQPVAREQMSKLLADRQDRPAGQLRLHAHAPQRSRPSWPGTRRPAR